MQRLRAAFARERRRTRLEWTEEGVHVARYELRTDILRAGEYKLLGFTGSCTYGIRGRDEPYVRALHTLADWALFAGVGMKSTQGMGQTRRLPG